MTPKSQKLAEFAPSLTPSYYHSCQMSKSSFKRNQVRVIINFSINFTFKCLKRVIFNFDAFKT